MKIVVLAGGISTERTVSLVSGTGVCQALRRKGHQAILVDMFMGLENPPADLNTLFDAPDGLCPDVKIEVQAPDLDAVRRSRPDQSPSRIGPHVLDICRLADHRVPGPSRSGRRGRPPSRQRWTCWASPIPVRAT